MRTITALSVQKRDPTRVNVYLDDAFAFGLDMDLALRLKVGQTLLPEEIDALQADDEVEKAKDRVLRLLARRPYSVTEIRRYLRRHRYSETVEAAVVDYVVEAGYADDEAFAEFWVEQRETFRPRSQRALQYELRGKGLDRELIDSALETYDETDAARRLAQKKGWRWQRLAEDEFRNKLGSYLQRQGFPYDIVREVVDESWQALHSESTDNE